MSLLALLTLWGLSISLVAGESIEQVHLALGRKATDMVVQWATDTTNAAQGVSYGSQSGNYPQFAPSDSWVFSDSNPNGTQNYHVAVLSDLEPNTKYYYCIQGAANRSQEFSFNTAPNGAAWSPRLLVYGDWGKDGGGPSLKPITAEVTSFRPTAILHVGDFAYDLHRNGGLTGDGFFRYIQGIAANVPYMTCPGNHEIAHNFTHYRNRFTMPSDSDNMYYSFDLGLVHFVAYSTEVYFTSQNSRPISNPNTNPQVVAQLAWLQKDLEAANARREQTPWIIAFGHRPAYCSNLDGDCPANNIVRTSLEKIFFDMGVDVVFEGHEHSYERLWPTYNLTVYQQDYNNPAAPVRIVAGAAGCNEDSGLCINPILAAGGDWSAYRTWGPTSYGYGRLEVINATHLHWEQISDLNGGVEDEIMIVQQNHGPFAERQLS